jgi:putative PEP-CTERM system histidine kinase
MDAVNYIDILAAVAGFVLSALLCIFPRFGPTSWMLVLILVPAFLSSLTLGLGPVVFGSPDDSALLSLAWLILCAASGCVGSYTFERADYWSDLKRNRWFFAMIFAVAPLLVSGLYVFRPYLAGTPANLVPLGPAGFGAAVYLLLASVIGLANVEQTLRSAEEHVRWEIKFLLLGLTAIFAAIIYIASQVLLYAPEYSFLSVQALRIFPVIFFCSCLLIFQSWRRGTGRERVVVSQGFVYSTITLLSVGGYLIGSSLVARWLSTWVRPSVPLEPVIFLVSAILLAAVLLGTTFQHRVRRWIRRNLFAGNYDYRQLWMDATERVRSIDSRSATASALAQLIHNALGSLDITVWVRMRDSETLQLTVARGTIAESLVEHSLLVSEIPSDLSGPIAVMGPGAERHSKWPPKFLDRTKASLVVPLISSERLVGLLTVGPDPGGRGLDREAREFLRVLAVHAASEFHKTELLESFVRAREAEAFQTFATFLLHDLKNFASTLSLIAKNAVRHHDNPDFQLDAFRSILDTAEKMKRLCNGLRTFSTSLAANKKEDDVNDIVHEVVREFEPSLSKRLKLELTPVPKIDIDRQEFARVLQNLILNAYEASPNGAIEVTTCAESAHINICIRDHGKGIPAAFLEKELFQPFHTTKGDGLGIGLFQSKKIVEAHQGTIEVKSEEGQGTVAQIILPLWKSQKTAVDGSHSDAATVNFPAGEALRHAAAKS